MFKLLTFAVIRVVEWHEVFFVDGPACAARDAPAQLVVALLALVPARGGAGGHPVPFPCRGHLLCATAAFPTHLNTPFTTVFITPRRSHEGEEQ
jgi:hypothetical protein